MAIPGVLVGALKTALKAAAKKAAEKALEQASAALLEEIGAKAMTDATAVLLNRMKSIPDKTILNTLSKNMGLPIGDIKSILSTFNQTAKMVELAKGENFKELARRSLKAMDIKVKYGDTIKDITRKAKEFNAIFDKRERENAGQPENYNDIVYSTLQQIQRDFIEKIHGVSNITNQFKVKQRFNLDLMKYFKPSKTYARDNMTALDKISDAISLDLERYEAGMGGDIYIIEEGPGKYTRYTARSVIDLINNTKTDVQAALL